MAPVVQRPSWVAWFQAGLLAVDLVWTTLCLGGFRAETMVVTSALTTAAFIVLLVRCAWENEENAARLHPAGWLFVPFLGYALINLLWITPVPWLGLRDGWGWAQMIAAFWVALDSVRTAGPRRWLAATVAMLGVVAVALASYQRFFDPHWMMLGRTQVTQFVGRSSGPFGIPNSFAAFLLLLIPPALAVAGTAPTRAKKVSAGILAVVYGVGLAFTVSRGAWISLGLALAVWPLLLRKRAWKTRLRFSGVVAGGVFGIGLVLYAAFPTVRERFDYLMHESGERTRPIMWRGAWQLWQDAPWAGTGAGSYNVLFERYRPEGYRDEPRYAHNDYLNTLSDYGAVGFALFFGAVLLVTWRAARARSLPAERENGDALTVGLLAFALSLLVDFHLKLPALALVVGYFAAKAVNARWCPPVPRRPDLFRRLALSGFALAIAIIFLRWIAPHYRAEAFRQNARAAVDTLAVHPVAADVERSVLISAEADLRRAVQLDRTNAQAWADVAYVTSLLARSEPARTRALGLSSEGDARRAVTLTQVVPEFWWRLGVALDMQGRWIEAGTAFERAVELAPKSSLGWYYQAYHLSLQPSGRTQAMVAVATCLRLDPETRVAELLRAQLASLPGTTARPTP